MVTFNHIHWMIQQYYPMQMIIRILLPAKQNNRSTIDMEVYLFGINGYVTIVVYDLYVHFREQI